MPQSGHRGDTDENVGVLVRTLRFFWLKLGNIVLVIIALFININGSRLDSTLDGLYAFTVALLLAARFSDGVATSGSYYRQVGAQAIDNGFKKYVMRLLIGAGVLWALAHKLCGLLG